MILEKLEVEVVAVYKSWKEFIAEIRKETPDFVIVDLLLENNEKGLDFIKEIKSSYIPTIVCTGYPEPEFMEEALNNGVRAFFTKPIDKAAMTYEIKKLVNEIRSENQNKYLVTKEKGILIKVPYSEIYKIEIEGNYAMLFTNSGKKFILKKSLKRLLDELDPAIFMRCHRSTVVNINYIKTLNVQTNLLGLSNGENVELGNKFKSSVKTMFKVS